VGIDGVFFETHPDPDSSPSDGPNMVPLSQFRSVLERVLQIHAVRVSMDEQISVMESGLEKNTGAP
jgi:2-dehydro-3-deoxyphosphooctonate aldolase (KDO 8-P synthase)